jgi:type II secretory ATPase GspE/PulE/Tfp pilus assembly ATPase PilB-like protein
MCTLHTDSIGGIINRLTDPKLGLTRQELTSSKVLGFLSYQALIAKLCQCALGSPDIQSYYQTQQQAHEVIYIQSITQQLHHKYNVDPTVLRFRNPEGCERCRKRGTKGLTMVAEMMIPDDDWLDIAATGNDRAAMRHWRQQHSDRNIYSGNMQGKLVTEHTIYKAICGEVDARQIERFGPLSSFEVLS